MAEAVATTDDAAPSQDAPVEAARRRPGFRVRLVVAATWLACRLPERPLLAVADLVGRAWFRFATERRARARRNLTRVVRWLADHDLGSPEARAAATDGRALTRLVREAFKFQVRYYVQLVRAPIVDRAYLERRLVVETPDAIHGTLDNPGGALFVGVHMGWFELPALIASARTGRPTLVPSETLPDPDIQAYLVATRNRMGLELIELGSAKRMLRQALLDGRAVGILGDRDITGGGIDTELFGATLPLAAGPALLALDTGVTPHVFGVWRDASDTYHVSTEPVPFPAEGTRRERVNGYLGAEARAFERLIARAPEQWLSVFHPLWPDLEQPRAPKGPSGARTAA